jgi:hypothetical protein
MVRRGLGEIAGARYTIRHVIADQPRPAEPFDDLDWCSRPSSRRGIPTAAPGLAPEQPEGDNHVQSIKAIILAFAAVSVLFVTAVQLAGAATINHPAALHHRLQRLRPAVHSGGAAVHNRAHKHEAKPRLHRAISRPIHK